MRFRMGRLAAPENEKGTRRPPLRHDRGVGGSDAQARRAAGGHQAEQHEEDGGNTVELHERHDTHLEFAVSVSWGTPWGAGRPVWTGAG